jgi:hypothetical protein
MLYSIESGMNLDSGWLQVLSNFDSYQLKASYFCIFTRNAFWISSISVLSKPWLEENPKIAMALDVSIGILAGGNGLKHPAAIMLFKMNFIGAQKVLPQ